MAAPGSTRWTWTSPLAVSIYVAVFALALGIGLALVVVVPTLRLNCWWFTRRCSAVTIQRGPANMLLVHDTRAGFTYWFDGINTIYSYGDNLAGSCPTSTSAGVTGATTTLGASIPAADACREVRADGSCAATYADPVCATVDVDTGECTRWTPPPSTTYTPTVLAGEKVGDGGAALFQPAFAVDASTMTLREGVYCTPPLVGLPAALLAAPKQAVRYTVPRGGGDAVTIYQIFALLKQMGVFWPPPPLPEAPVPAPAPPLPEAPAPPAVDAGVGGHSGGKNTK
jgi:hypothetical protein